MDTLQLRIVFVACESHFVQRSSILIRYDCPIIDIGYEEE